MTSQEFRDLYDLMEEVKRSQETLTRLLLEPGYDKLTRTNVSTIATVVPTLAEADSATTSFFLADRYYCPIGAVSSTATLPTWLYTGGSNVSFQNWDATRKQFYARLASINATGTISSNVPMAHPLGVFGLAPDYAPKNAAVGACWLKFTARFNANADYSVYGVGLFDAGGFINDPFIQVTRDTGDWELHTRDSSTVSTSSDASADGDFHEFGVRWSEADVKLYVDGSLIITKTTNLPTIPLQPLISAENNTNTIDVVDYLIEWELA